jgi:hypothetical protein
MLRAGLRLTSGRTTPSGGSGRWSVTPSPYVGITPRTGPPRNVPSPSRSLNQTCPRRRMVLLMKRERGKKSAREKGEGPRSPGRWLCGLYAPGWSPGSCSGVLGKGGRRCPHLLCCRSFLHGWNKGMLWRSPVPRNPTSTHYCYRYFVGSGPKVTQ